jgi:hypothetical protein
VNLLFLEPYINQGQLVKLVCSADKKLIKCLWYTFVEWQEGINKVSNITNHNNLRSLSDYISVVKYELKND